VRAPAGGACARLRRERSPAGGRLSEQKVQPTPRSAYRHFTPMPTRWGDNDVYGHVNNVVHYALFDSAVNRQLIESGVLDIAGNAVVGLVVETRCTFFSPIAFPDTVHVGLKVVHLGNSSVRYEIALFRNEADVASAVGSFVHVYVERATGRPVPIPPRVRAVLRGLSVE
jgi:acyl-CoA thioester hydrolase